MRHSFVVVPPLVAVVAGRLVSARLRQQQNAPALFPLFARLVVEHTRVYSVLYSQVRLPPVFLPVVRVMLVVFLLNRLRRGKRLRLFPLVVLAFLFHFDEKVAISGLHNVSKKTAQP